MGERDTSESTQWTWRSPSGAPGGSKTWSPLILSVVVVGVFAALLANGGHVLGAVLAIGVFVSVQVLARKSKRFAKTFDLVTNYISRTVGVILSRVLLLPIYYLVITPLGFLLRLLGVRPLSLRSESGRTSYWTVRGGQVGSRPRRLYTNQAKWHPLGASQSDRRRIVATTVASILFLQASVAGGLWLVDREDQVVSEPASESTGVAFIGAADSAALRDLEWAEQAFADTGGVTAGLVYTPFVESSLRDYESQYVNVTNRVRLSYQTQIADPDPLEVWFFGGSTMFGFDLQRDMHTIPSEIVRLAEDDGVAINASNYGSAGFVNFQETVLLSQLVTAGKKPDVVVFYDGTNDWATGLLNITAGLNPVGEPGTLGAHQNRQALLEQGVLPPGATDGSPSPLGLVFEQDPSLGREPFVEGTMSVYQQGIDLAISLGDTYGFEVVHYWQPDIYSKAELDPGERELLPSLGLTNSRYEIMKSMLAELRQELPDGVIDISDALDGLDEPVLADVVHINEVGGRAVAESMYETLAAVFEQS